VLGRLGTQGTSRVSVQICWLFSCYFKFRTITVCSAWVPETRGTGRTSVLLGDKNAVMYRGGGKVGGAVAREVAKVFLTGRTLESLEESAASNKQRR
jgi:xanthine/CO dehydrogenase XdhC/CoxF family maturation factor